MRKYLILLPAILLSACAGNFKPSNEYKAKTLIENHLKNTLPNPNSYDPGNYYGLDSLFIDPNMKKMIDELLKASGDTTEYKKAIAAQKKQFSGFQMTHTFSFKNSGGNVETHTWEFNFNKSLTSIANIEKDNEPLF